MKDEEKAGKKQQLHKWELNYNAGRKKNTAVTATTEAGVNQPE